MDPDQPVPARPARPARRVRRWAWPAVAVALVAATAVVCVVLITGSEPQHGTHRGAPSAHEAAERFVAALNAGDRDAAAAISCGAFQNQARSEAMAGADPGIGFSLEAVSVHGSTATARVGQRFELPDGVAPQTEQLTMLIEEDGGRWLVCAGGSGRAQ